MNLCVYLFWFLISVGLSTSEHHDHADHDHHDSSHSHEGSGRGFFDKMKMLSPMNIFAKGKQKFGQGRPTMAPIKGPIENSSLYKTALDSSDFFVEDTKFFKSCKGKPIHLAQNYVQAVITCSNETEAYECFKSCILKEIGIVKYERLDMRGLTSWIEKTHKDQSDEIKRACKKSFVTCFEDGTRLMVSGPKCTKNKKIIDCLKEQFTKVCGEDDKGANKKEKNDKKSSEKSSEKSDEKEEKVSSEKEE